MVTLIDVKKQLTITSDDLITHKAEIPEQLMEMRLTVGQTSLFVMMMTKKWFLALGAHKMLHQKKQFTKISTTIIIT